MSERPMSPDPQSPEPADLSDLAQLAETDALLDRLGGRRITAGDRDDPAVALLAGLVSAIDEGPDVDQDLAHLIEVLDGRPLFAGSHDAVPESEVTPLDRPIELATLVEPGRRVIDLTDHAPVAPAEQLPADLEPGESGAAEPPAARTGADVVPIAPRAARDETAGPARGEGENGADVGPISHWHKALRSVSMPAAAAVALIALGSGVSAVVTGNPMAPVNGVSRVMSQLPGTGTSGSTTSSRLVEAQAEILAADSAARRHDAAGAQNHLAAARDALADVPAAQKVRLTSAIASIQTAITTGTTPPPNPITASSPPAGVSTPPPATIAPPTTPAGEPTPTDTGSPSTPPTTDSPTTPPTTPPDSPTTDPATSPAVADTSPAGVPDTPAG